MIVGLLIVIVVELAFVLELLRRNIGAAGGQGWVPWRYKIGDLFDRREYGREYLYVLAALLVIGGLLSWFINTHMAP